MMKGMLLAGAIAVTVLRAAAADFATPGGPAPANLDEVARTLDGEGAAIELLLSFGTSKGGSAGHLALALREASGTEQVRSANFYADRDPAHERDRYTEALIVSVPKWEYLYGTTSSLGSKASFGLDYGEVYKRSVVGVRVYGVPLYRARGSRRLPRSHECRLPRPCTRHRVPAGRGEVLVHGS